MGKIIFLIGKPCSGKSTWLRNLKEKRSGEFVILSMGEIIRNAKNNGELTPDMIEAMESGKLLPDYLVTNYLHNAVRNIEEPVIVDGFPRNLEQAEDITEIGLDVDRVIHLLISDEVVNARSSERMICMKCQKSHLPKKLVSFLPKCEDIIIKEDGKCNFCGGPLVRREDDAKEKINTRLKIYEEQTIPAIKYLERCGISVIMLNGESLKEDDFEKAVNMPI